MQKLLLAVLFFSLLAIATARPKYHKQGRRKGDACRLHCLFDNIVCETPCRVLFRSRFSYHVCARDCRKDRVDCYIGCKNIDANPKAEAEPGSLDKEAGTKGEKEKNGKKEKKEKKEKGEYAIGNAESGTGSSGGSNKTHDDDDDDHDDVYENDDENEE
uniref:Uncharacterized shell protein 1 n=1 Tax=Pinctada maxima TaxID=104660 RepID=USP1_PINMA|nr:RecName: Full=Uncharacterized shell protein 1; AltName: Full=Prism uncharacterized shell protein 2; Short=PUSP2; Flags: Precursor [Pinctada maxima]